MAGLRASLLVLLVACAVLVQAQPPGSNPGLPPSATATGLAPQMLADMAVTQQQTTNRISDQDILAFLVNTECLEATFDSFAVFGEPPNKNLVGDGPAPQGGKRANLSDEIQLYFEEVARDEIGHVRILREALGPAAPPCPLVNIDTAFDQFFSTAFGQNVSWDPYKNDINFILSTFALEEVGATGDQGATLITASNCPTNLTNVAIAGGLAGSAYGQSTADRMLLWQRRNETVPELNVTVAEAVDRLSALRQNWTGSVMIDQGLVYAGGINIIPTDGNGVTLARTPQQVLNILTGNSTDGKGLFFPNGVNGNLSATRPLDPQVPAELLALANAPYTIVMNSSQVDDPLLPVTVASITPNQSSTVQIIAVNGSYAQEQAQAQGNAATPAGAPAPKAAPTTGATAPSTAPSTTTIVATTTTTQGPAPAPTTAPAAVTAVQTQAPTQVSGAPGPTGMTASGAGR